MQVYYSDRFLKHSLGRGHPECPERLRVIRAGLEGKKNCKILEPKPIDKEELELVHGRDYLQELVSLSAAKATFPDNIFSEHTFDISALAASAARDAAMNCENDVAFALVRPPGHHAGKGFFGGFCYINNIAFATRSLQKKKKARGMIIDIDYHHGNGTQNIFRNDDSVFYLSLHADPKTEYPGTGFESENNKHITNVPLPPDTTDGDYIGIFGKALDKSVKSFEPEFIAVSAGFDTYYMDPIAGLGIRDIGTYGKIGEKIASLKLPTFVVLEGGYYLPKLDEISNSFFSSFQKI